MLIRSATIGDAPALGRVMVESWLSAHRGQMPDVAWQKRVDEWTPDVSAQGWARVLVDQADGNVPRDVLLVAEDDSRVLHAWVYGTPADDDLSGATAEISSRKANFPARRFYERWVDRRSADERPTKRTTSFPSRSTHGRTSPPCSVSSARPRQGSR
jgi:hypothetical protein